MAMLMAIAFIYVGVNMVVSGVNWIMRILSKEDKDFEDAKEEAFRVAKD